MDNIFDFNIHLPLIDKGAVNSVVADEFNQDPAGLIAAIDNYQDDFKRLNGGHIMVFNTKLYDFAEAEVQQFTSRAQAALGEVWHSALTDFTRPDAAAYIERAHGLGACGIKFHAYHQQIGAEAIPGIVELCTVAAARGMMISIDTSYGTSKMYEHDNLKLACAVADAVTNVPIVLLHSGGARTLEAMLLAHEKSNVYIETSFSMGYYEGSSLWQDFAFVYRKIGTERIIYGSDYPYVSMSDSEAAHQRFFEQHKFTSKEIDDIMGNSGRAMLAGLNL